MSADVIFSRDVTDPNIHKMHRYKVGEEMTANFLSGLTSTNPIINFSMPITLITTNWVIFGRYTSVGGGEYSLWRVDPVVGLAT